MLWQRVDELVDRAPSLEALRAHGLSLLGLRRLAARGLPAPRSLLLEERTAALRALMTPRILERVLALCEGPIVVLKGPVVAARYPPRTRTYGDLDLLVEDAPRLHSLLLDDGFVAPEDPSYTALDIRYHLQPLIWGKLPLRIEVHSAVNWPPELKQPPIEAFFEQARDAELGIPGILAPSPVHHSLLLTAHAWNHRPLGSLRDLLDVALMSRGIPEDELDAAAREWELGRLWRTSRAAIEAVLYERRRPTFAMRIYARHLLATRERTVLENHLERLLSPFDALPPRQALARVRRALRSEFKPLEDERWRDKLNRSWRAIGQASTPRSEHERALASLYLRRQDRVQRPLNDAAAAARQASPGADEPLEQEG